MTVVTGHEIGGSTAADVFIELFGRSGSSGKRYLRRSVNKREQTDDGDDGIEQKVMFSMGSVSVYLVFSWKPVKVRPSLIKNRKILVTVLELNN